MSDCEIKKSSILLSIKKLLGISDFDDSFNTDIILHINSVLSILRQLGVGKDTDFVVTGNDETWDDFLDESLIADQRMVTSYVYQKVRLLFDPPTNSFTIEAIKQSIAEMEWRLSVSADKKKEEERCHGKHIDPPRH